MGLKDYLLGRRFVLRSPLPSDEVASRIRGAAGNLFNPFREGVSGWCRFGHLRLFVAKPLFDNGFQPTFAGRMSENLGMTELRVRFGASLSLRVFFAFWYGMLSLLMLTLMPVVLSGDLQTGYEPLGVAVALVFMAIPLLFHYLFNRGADGELEQIFLFLEREAILTIQA